MANMLEEVESKLLQAEEAKAYEIINEIIKPVENKEIAILPEEIFKEYFLDFFRDPNKDLNSPILLKWYEISRGPFNEVTIIDDNGDPLFIVPSVYPKVEPADALNNISFGEIANTYMMESSRLKAAGEQVLERSLNGMENQLNIKLQENVIKWAEIFKRYENPKQTNIDNNPVIKNEDEDINDFLQY